MSFPLLILRFLLALHTPRLDTAAVAAVVGAGVNPKSFVQWGADQATGGALAGLGCAKGCRGRSACRSGRSNADAVGGVSGRFNRKETTYGLAVVSNIGSRAGVRMLLPGSTCLAARTQPLRTGVGVLKVVELSTGP